MIETRTTGRLALAAGALLALTTLTGCGDLTIRTWVKVIEAESSGSIRFFSPTNPPFEFERIQGGFLATIVVNTTDILAPLEGTLSVDDIRLAASEPRQLGYFCAWQDPTQPSVGSVYLDLFGGQGHTQLTANLRTTSGFTGTVTEISAETELNLEGDLLSAFLGASESGSADGLFATRAPFEGTADVGGIQAFFSLDLAVTNDTTPPLFDADHLYNCAWYWEPDQGSALYHGVNSKSSYLRAWPGDEPTAPRVIALADIGALPGETISLAQIGAFSDSTELEDGNKTTMTAVFSSTNQLLGTSERYRIPGAINAGADINTGGYWSCFLIFCSFKSSDIPQDFRVDPGLGIVVPPGANYLFVAPLSPEREWEDNSGFGFGLDVDPGPYPY
jgi:hypothetical protein